MSVSLSQVRTQISDRPQMYPPMSAAPEIISPNGGADGVSTIFALTFENYIPGTLTIYEATAPAAGTLPSWIAAATSTYSVGAVTPISGTAATNAVITFNAPPASGTLIGARYQATAFSDTDLTFYLASAVALGYPDDVTTLKRVQYDIIPIILGDQRRMTILSEGSFKGDIASYAASLRALVPILEKSLAGGPVPGANVPQLGVMGRGARRYLPYR